MRNNDKLLDMLHKRAMHAGGGHLTKETRLETVGSFVSWCAEHNRQITEPRNRDIRDYIQSRMDAGVGIGTLQKRPSHLRAVAPSVSYRNKELGISNRSRIGEKRPPTAAEYQKRYNRIQDAGVRAAAELQRTPGPSSNGGGARR